MYTKVIHCISQYAIFTMFTMYFYSPVPYLMNASTYIHSSVQPTIRIYTHCKKGRLP